MYRTSRALKAEAVHTDYSADVAAIAHIAAVPTILEVVCRTTGMGFAAVARVTEDRWIACGVRDEIQFGLRPGGELRVETTICNEVRGLNAPIVIDHVAEDECFSAHPTPAMYGFQSYLSMPIVLPDGSFFGTLCAIDPQPRKLNTPETLATFRLFAELIALHIDAHMRVAASAASLLDERATAGLREQFIAVLGHDLRNPLAAIDSGAQLLLRTPLSDGAVAIVERMRSSVGRMAGLIEDVLDFARGRLGGGLSIDTVADVPLAAPLHHVVEELRGSHPDKDIAADLDGIGTVRCDPGRIGQLLSNLLANALTHGASDGPVRVHGMTHDGSFALSVSNTGEPIPAEIMSKVFEPFVRASGRPHQQGLGLGLYISCEIARAHGGTLDVTSTLDETRFTFRMPLS